MHARPLRSVVALLALLPSLTAPDARAADTEMSELLSGRHVPLTLQLKDLDATWRRFTLGDAPSGAASPASAYLALFGASQSAASFTKGDIVTVHGEPFLIAYRLESKPIDVQMFLRGGMRPDQLPRPEPPTADAALQLSLIHLRSAGHLEHIQPFDLERELAGGDDSPEGRAHAREQAAKAAGLDDLRQLGVALLAYAADGDKTLPPLDDLAATRQALQPYAGGKDLLGDPPYRANAALSRKKLAALEKPEQVVVFYEAKPVRTGRGVLFLDCHVERVSEERWKQLRKAAGITD